MRSAPLRGNDGFITTLNMVKATTPTKMAKAIAVPPTRVRPGYLTSIRKPSFKSIQLIDFTFILRERGLIDERRERLRSDSPISQARAYHRPLVAASRQKSSSRSPDIHSRAAA